MSAKGMNSDYSEFGLIHYKNSLVFTSTREFDLLNYGEVKYEGNTHLSILVTEHRTKGDTTLYKEPQVFANALDLGADNGPIVFNIEGDICYFQRVNRAKSKKAEHFERPQLYKSVLVNNRWSRGEKLNFVNDEYTYGHPSISQDGKTLYFCSNMPGGQGGQDIYQIEIKEDGWGKPKNLGKGINSASNELFPHIAVDGHFYFSSDRKSGFGGLDIYSSTLDGDEWMEASNLGKTINTPYDDFSFYMLADKKSGYFASNRPGTMGGDDIFKFISRKSIRMQLSIVAGRIAFESEKTDYTQKEVYLISEKGDTVSTTTLDENGEFDFGKLPNQENYIIRIAGEGEQGMSSAQLIFQDEQGEDLGTLVQDEHGKFAFKPLNYLPNAQFSELDDTDSDFILRVAEVSGQFSYSVLPDKYPAGMMVYLVSAEGDTINAVAVDEDGKFSFGDLPLDNNYLIKIDENDPRIKKSGGLKLAMLDEGDEEDEVITDLTTDSNGDFVFKPLSYDKTDKLAYLMEKEDGLMVSAIQNEEILGQFLFNKLPGKYPARVKVYLIGDDGEILATVYTDSLGQFEFKDLPVGTNYIIKIDEDDPSLISSVALMVPDQEVELLSHYNEAQKSDLVAMKGQLNYPGNSDDYPEQLKVYLLNNAGNVLYTRVTDQGGYFAFENLPPNQDYIIRLDLDDPEFRSDMQLTMLDADGDVLSVKIMSKTGSFAFTSLQKPKTKMLAMMVDDESNIKGSFEGRFSYDILPAKYPVGTIIYLLSQEGDTIGKTKIGADGYFRFNDLPIDIDYIVSLDERGLDDKLSMVLELVDEKGKVLRTIKDSKNNTFAFGKLQYQLNSNHLALQYLPEDDDLEIGTEYKLVRGQLTYKGSPNTKVNGVKLYLMSKSGQILATSKTDPDGYFKFYSLPEMNNYIVQIEGDDLDKSLEAVVSIFDEKGRAFKVIVQNDEDSFSFSLLRQDLITLGGLDEDGENQLSVMETMSVGGNFKYSKLPGKYPVGSIVYLLSLNGDTINMTEVDERGDFEFRNLPANIDYIIKLKNSDNGSMEAIYLKMVDEQGGMVAEVEDFEKAKEDFIYNPLAYKIHSSLSLMEGDDDGLMVIPIDNVIEGDFDFAKLPNQYQPGMKIFLLSVEGDTITSVIADESGAFKFEGLDNKQEYTISLEEKVFDDIAAIVKDDIKANEESTTAKEDVSTVALAKEDMVGQFSFSKLPGTYPVGAIVYLTNEDGDILYQTTVNEAGNFVFKDLPADVNYLVRIENSDGSTMEAVVMKIVDETGAVITTVEIVEESNSDFVYNPLAYRVHKSLTLMEGEDAGLMVMPEGNVIQGDFDYAKLPSDYAPGMKIFLLDEAGDTLTFVVADESGAFKFEGLKEGAKYSIAIEEKVIEEIAAIVKEDIKKSEETTKKEVAKNASPVSVPTDEAKKDEVQEEVKKTAVTYASNPNGRTLYLDMLYYKSGYFHLDRSGKKTLDLFVKLLTEIPSINLQINSYSDSKGSSRLNMSVSNERAKWIVNYLVTRGIDASRLEAKGFGETQLVFKCEDDRRCPEYAHRQNRRTEIVITGKGIEQLNIIFRDNSGKSKKTHNVSKDQTLYAIANLYKISVDKLKKLNGMINNYIVAGDVLVVE